MKTESTSAQKKAKNLEKAQLIMSDINFAHDFMFNVMRRKMASLASSYNRFYGLNLSPDDVAHETMLALWSDNWAKLKTYRGDTSIYSYVALIASQAIHKSLIDDGFIPPKSPSSASDYRLTLLSISDPGLRQMIVDLVYRPNYHRVLTLRYVEKVDFEEVECDESERKEIKKILSNAEKMLIDQLINTENPFFDMALSRKVPSSIEVPLQPWHDRIQDEEELSDNHQKFRSVLAKIFMHNDSDDNAFELANAIVVSLKWNAMRKEIFYERFFNRTPSKVIAEKFHIHYTRVDNIYSQLRREFVLAAKGWWEHNNQRYSE